MTGAYEMWAWLVTEADGTEGVIAAALAEGSEWHSNFGPLLTLHARSRAVAEHLEPLARAHGAAAGRPVRLAHLIETTPP